MKNLFFLILFFSFNICISQNEVQTLKLSQAAIELTHQNVVYDPSYFSINYPNGDVPKGKGVCTDVVIRAYRKLGIDLQKLVHEDMKANFDKYPSKRIWGLSRTDKNIDHRRVPNLERFFERKGMSKPAIRDRESFIAGDIVSWRLPGNLPHIGIVSDRKAEDGTPLIIHNIGAGAREENILFTYQMTGHYRPALDLLKLGNRPGMENLDIRLVTIHRREGT